MKMKSIETDKIQTIEGGIDCYRASLSREKYIGYWRAEFAVLRKNAFQASLRK